MKKIKLGHYKHFKGMIVEVIGVALHSETKEEMVVYNHSDPTQEDTNTMRVRSKKMFLETVYKDGREIPRFQYIG